MRAIEGRRASTVGRGQHRIKGTPGLFVRVAASGSRSWIYRGWNGTKEIARGLGSVIDVTLTDARNAAVKLRAGIIDGAAVPTSRQRSVRRAPVHTWADAWAHLADTREIEPTTMASYASTWRCHVDPVLGSRDVAKTSREDVIALITSKTGSVPNKVRKLAAMLGKLAVSLGWIAVNPADGDINAALPKSARQTTDGRRRAMPYAELGAFLAELPETAAADALRMLTLTGVRLSDVLGAEWSEIDTEAAVWTIPGDRKTKSKASFPVPLTAPVLAIIERQRGRSERYVFPSTRVASRPVSRPAVARLFPTDKYDLHGLRASLKTWSAETGQDREATEAVLSHVDGTSTERRYQRSDLIDRRRAVLDTWAAYLTD